MVAGQEIEVAVVICPGVENSCGRVFKRCSLAEHAAGLDSVSHSDHFSDTFPGSSVQLENVYRQAVSGRGTHADDQFRLCVIGEIMCAYRILVGIQLFASFKSDFRVVGSA